MAPGRLNTGNLPSGSDNRPGRPSNESDPPHSPSSATHQGLPTVVEHLPTVEESPERKDGSRVRAEGGDKAWSTESSEESGVRWGNNPFDGPSHATDHTGFGVRHSQFRGPGRSGFGNIARRTSIATGEIAHRSAHAAGNLARRTSIATGELARASAHVAVEAAELANPLKMKGNPLGLEINETRRLSSVGYVKPGSFDGRRFSEAVTSRTQSVSTDILRKQSVAFQRRELKEDPEDYVIQRLAGHDDAEHMSPLKRRIYRFIPLLASAATVSYWAYFALRVRYTRDAEKAANKVFGMAWAFIAVELCVAIPMILHRFWTMLVIGGRRRPKLRLLGASVPSVDVVITCCGEEDDLVLDTAKAACNVDYPIDRFRVIICDDGRSQTLREMTEYTAHHLFDNLYYRSRPKYPGVPHHFKAGNLNYALEETKLMPGGAANFVAALDADMIPEKDWLRALLPHLLQDPKCSMACPPQLFYNIPVDDPLCQSLNTFVHISEPIKDAMGVAWCTGSGYILRRKAMDDIGGFPIGSLAEDVCCSSMLLGSGWNTAFVHEPLQWGTVPDSLTSHLKQRTRWTIGTIQTSLKLRFNLWGPLVKHMTFMQRLCGFIYTISSLFTMFLVASMFTVPIVLISGGNLVPYTTFPQLQWLIWTNFASMVLNRVTEFVLYLPSGYRTGQRDMRGMMWMAPYHAISVIRSFLLPKWLGGKVAVFTSSGSQTSELNERDPLLRAPWYRRLKVTLWDCNAYLHLLYILFVVVAVAVSTYHCFAENGTARTKALALLTHAGWPPVLWLICVVSCWAPIHYALFPPDMPPREDLLERDPKTGIAYPTEEAKDLKSSKMHWIHEAQYSFLSVYTTIIFVLSFWI